MTHPNVQTCELCHKEFRNLKLHLKRKTPCNKKIVKQKNDPVFQLENQFEKLNIEKYQKPLLKWVGGKTQLLDTIMHLFPQCIENYYEPFVGGGSVLFAFLCLVQNEEIKVNAAIHAYDSNKKLIDFYVVVQNHCGALYEEIKKLNEDYNSINTLNGNRKPSNKEEALQSKESYYYYNRKIFNQTTTDDIKSASLFLFLNKTCFRGVYRESPKSGFNVPFGNYASTLVMVSKNELFKVHNLIKNVVFKCQDFQKLSAKSGDFVYFDPPYYPVKKGKSFLGYTPNGFNSHKELFTMLRDLNEKNVKFVMSNSCVQEVKDATETFEHIVIDARRAIHCKKPGSTCQELLIQNYF